MSIVDWRKCLRQLPSTGWSLSSLKVGEIQGTHNSLTQFPRNYRMNRSNSHSGAFVFRPVSPGSHPFRALITTRSNTSERSPVRGRLRNPSSRNRHPVSGVQELASGYQEEPHPSGTLFRPQGGSESQPRHSGIFVNFRRENQTMPRFLEPPLISQEVSEALPRDPFVSLSHFPHRPQITGPGTGSQSQHVYQRQGSINTEESRYHLLCPGSNNGNREFAQSLSLVRRPSPESDEPQSFVNTLAPSQEPQCSLAFPKPSLGSSHGRNIQLTSSGPSANFLPRILSIQRPPGPIPWLANDAQPRALSPRPPNFVSWIIEQSHPLIPLQIHETVESLDRFTQAASGSTIRPRPVTIRQDSIERDHNHVLASSSVLSRGIRRSGSAFELVSGSHLPQLCSSRPVP